MTTQRERERRGRQEKKERMMTRDTYDRGVYYERSGIEEKTRKLRVNFWADELILSFVCHSKGKETARKSHHQPKMKLSS